MPSSGCIMKLHKSKLIEKGPRSNICTIVSVMEKKWLNGVLRLCYRGLSQLYIISGVVVCNQVLLANII